MTKIRKSDYVKVSKALVIKLYKLGYWGKGYLYEDNLKDGFPPEDKDKVVPVAEALVKQKICKRKKKEHGWKYFLNMERFDKIKKIIREK